MLIESTYGDRTHPTEDLLAELAPALQRLAKRGGVAVVPVFAVGRAQALLHAIAQLKKAGALPRSLPVFLDSPMAVHTTHLFDQFPDDHRLTPAQSRALTTAATMVSSVDDSKALAGRHGPMVILSASGMATGGRVLHHLTQHAGNHRNMIMLTGYQAPGTRGATLVAIGQANQAAQGNPAAGLPNSAKTVRIHGRDVLVNAEVVQLQAASAHADAHQLIDWLRTMPEAPGQVYVTHGEMAASDALRLRIKNELEWRALVPESGSTWPC